MDSTKTVVGVTTIIGGDALIYSDGSIVALVEVQGAKQTYFVTVPVDIEMGLKAEDAGNADYKDLPGFVAPADDTAAAGEAAAQ